MNITRLIAATVMFAALATPAAFAQQVPGDAGGPPPSYARPSYAHGEETIRGRVASFDGRFHLDVRDDRGFTDNVQLHQGTIINPTGLTLQPGMSVTIVGKSAGSFFVANEIDTPYDRYGLFVPERPSASYAIGIGIR